MFAAVQHVIACWFAVGAVLMMIISGAFGLSCLSPTYDATFSTITNREGFFRDLVNPDPAYCEPVATSAAVEGWVASLISPAPASTVALDFASAKICASEPGTSVFVNPIGLVKVLCPTTASCVDACADCPGLPNLFFSNDELAGICVPQSWGAPALDKFLVGAAVSLTYSSTSGFFEDILGYYISVNQSTSACSLLFGAVALKYCPDISVAPGLQPGCVADCASDCAPFLAARADGTGNLAASGGTYEGTCIPRAALCNDSVQTTCRSCSVGNGLDLITGECKTEISGALCQGNLQFYCPERRQNGGGVLPAACVDACDLDCRSYAPGTDDTIYYTLGTPLSQATCTPITPAVCEARSVGYCSGVDGSCDYPRCLDEAFSNCRIYERIGCDGCGSHKARNATSNTCVPPSAEACGSTDWRFCDGFYGKKCIVQCNDFEERPGTEYGGSFTGAFHCKSPANSAIDLVGLDEFNTCAVPSPANCKRQGRKYCPYSSSVGLPATCVPSCISGCSGRTGVSATGTCVVPTSGAECPNDDDDLATHLNPSTATKYVTMYCDGQSRCAVYYDEAKTAIGRCSSSCPISQTQSPNATQIEIYVDAWGACTFVSNESCTAIGREVCDGSYLLNPGQYCAEVGFCGVATSSSSSDSTITYAAAGGGCAVLVLVVLIVIAVMRRNRSIENRINAHSVYEHRLNAQIKKYSATRKPGVFDRWIFISYTHRNAADKAKVLQVVQALKERNFRVWRDEEQMRQKIYAAMMEGVFYSSAVLAFISEDYLRSTPCRDEYNCATFLKKPRFPVLLMSRPNLANALQRIAIGGTGAPGARRGKVGPDVDNAARAELAVGQVDEAPPTDALHMFTRMHSENLLNYDLSGELGAPDPNEELRRLIAMLEEAQFGKEPLDNVTGC